MRQDRVEDACHSTEPLGDWALFTPLISSHCILRSRARSCICDMVTDTLSELRLLHLRNGASNRLDLIRLCEDENR